MVSVAFRASPVFAATLKVTFPLPLPIVADVIETHATLLTAVHAQPAFADTATEEFVDPEDGVETVVGLTV